MQTDSETIERLVEELRASAIGNHPPKKPPTSLSNGGGSSNRMPDDQLKSRVDFLQTAFLWLAGALVTAVIGVIAIAVTLSNSTNVRLDKVNEAMSGLNREVGQVSVKIDASNNRLDRMDEKLDQISRKLDKR